MGLEHPVVKQILTIVRWEDTLHAGSLLPVGLGTISDRHTPTISICINNSITGVNDLVLLLSAWQV